MPLLVLLKLLGAAVLDMFVPVAGKSTIGADTTGVAGAVFTFTAGAGVVLVPPPAIVLNILPKSTLPDGGVVVPSAGEVGVPSAGAGAGVVPSAGGAVS